MRLFKSNQEGGGEKRSPNRTGTANNLKLGAEEHPCILSSLSVIPRILHLQALWDAKQGCSRISAKNGFRPVTLKASEQACTAPQRSNAKQVLE